VRGSRVHVPILLAHGVGLVSADCLSPFRVGHDIDVAAAAIRREVAGPRRTDLLHAAVEIPHPGGPNIVDRLGGLCILENLGYEHRTPRQTIHPKCAGELVAVVAAAKVPNLGPSQLNNLARVSAEDRKSTRLNSSHVKISYAVF